MTPPRIAAAVAAAASTVVLALPAVAGAASHAGQHNFEQSYPVASKLCANIAKGAGPVRLRASAPTVLADCTTLENNFNTDRAAVLATEASISAALLVDNAARRLACVGKPDHPVACGIARRNSQLLHRRLDRQKVHAARAYWRTLEADRAAFWAEIRALPGGGAVAPDKPIEVQNS